VRPRRHRFAGEFSPGEVVVETAEVVEEWFEDESKAAWNLVPK